MTELEEKIKQADIERKRRYPMLDISDNRAEIRKIAQDTQDYLTELNSQLMRIKIWEVIPRVIIEFILSCFEQLKSTDVTKTGTVSVVLGDIVELGLDFTRTSDADKFGNITPYCECRSEWKYENSALPYRDEVPLDEAHIMEDEKCSGLPIQFFENREEIKEISIRALKVLYEKYGVKFGVTPDDTKNWWIIPLIFVAFMRKAKDFLIEHKDDGGIGVTINFANYIEFGIRKEGGLDEDDPVDYFLFISPEQIFKKENAKNDAKTEADV